MISYRYCRYIFPGLLFFTFLFYGCRQADTKDALADLYSGFQTPPAEARPFVRWWWNGNKVNKEELSRELSLLKEAGFGGIEINPIAFPEGSHETGELSKIWMSDEWIDLVVHTCQEAKESGMIADLIVGSGWPFGGEFLEEDEILQRVVQHQIRLTGFQQLSYSVEELKSLLEESGKDIHHPVRFNPEYQHDLLYMHVIPLKAKSPEEIIDLTHRVSGEGKLEVKLPEGEFILDYGFVQRGHRQVMHGSPGAAGPVMDHYKKNVTLAYLSRLLKISEKSGIPLSDLLRALFCDSIELAGSNWTDGFAALFFENYGYKIDPWLAWIFSGEQNLPHLSSFDEALKDQISRVRYDYNRLLVDVFLENFTRTFQNFCTENNLLCRYQAYGTPFLMGMLEGYTIPDIPESNNWIFSAYMDSPDWEWSQGHGYMIWNMYAAAGGHVTGRKIISCEAMTNTRGVFRASLEDFKQHDDMNFITGINHSVLHGYNYSPPEAGFPGWIRYGAYFSEHNTWWPYLHKWVDYNSRLSYIFQNSRPVKSIAVLGPESDLWARKGLERIHFHMEPEYLHRLWEPVSQLGYSCEYLNEKLIQQAELSGNKLKCGEMEYSALVLADIQSMHPETARKIYEFVKAGGKLAMVGTTPSRSLNFMDAQKDDREVREIFEAIADQQNMNVSEVNSPSSATGLLVWTRDMLNELGVEPDVNIENPSESVYQIHQKTPEADLFFFTNTHREDSASFMAVFNIKNKQPYIWDPESGERSLFSASDPTKFTIALAPLQSLLLVFEEGQAGKGIQDSKSDLKEAGIVSGPWKVEAQHVNGNTYAWSFENLKDISLETNPELSTFAGKMIYKNRFTHTGSISYLSLDKLNGGIAEVRINGEFAGMSWYGDAFFDIHPFLVEGENSIEIEYTGLLWHYCRSLDDPTAQRWVGSEAVLPSGMSGLVRLWSEK